MKGIRIQYIVCINVNNIIRKQFSYWYNSSYLILESFEETSNELKMQNGRADAKVIYIKVSIIRCLRSKSVWMVVNLVQTNQERPLFTASWSLESSRSQSARLFNWHISATSAAPLPRLRRATATPLPRRDSATPNRLISSTKNTLI